MTMKDVCFHVCEGCGPKGLADALRRSAPRWSQSGLCVAVRTPTCLSACRFGNVVVMEADGEVTRYSSVNRNGFRAFDADPLRVLQDTLAASDHEPSRPQSGKG